MIADLVRKNRSCRRFYQNHAVENETLMDLVNLARLSASAANLQPLRYILSSTPQHNERIFACLAWAGYLKDWPGPKEGERPSAYIIVLGDTTKAKDFDCDHGIAAQSILLGAREAGLAGCMIASINREKLREVFDISEDLKILLVIALGKPKEQVVIEEVGSDGSIRYWRDEQGVHHVPKRTLADIIVATY
ncbi:MAG: nitroreductase family protein [Deltaproteobacteria bacterium]|nr:nitroreductase family protein [Deltaproteobacteria bacterium]MBW1955852.1 nitroreductase family protein [Deltaproteobacteria bacterium]MBW2041212.1 nitroreductase family protein [Deltaproteobacteria bacterium]MBW2132194.1 nitroreductase family protein [Deltaproteobacteria bacterium]